MPIAKFGEKTSLEKRGGKIFKLAHKDEKVTVRFLGDGFYTGKHFVQREDGSWDIFFCPRIMLDKPCSLCQKFFEKQKELKKMIEAKEDEKKIEAIKREVRKLSPTIRFYYPALNRDTGKPMILEVPLSIRLKLEDFVEAGMDIFESDFVYRRTEKPGSDYYTLIRKDSKDTPVLTEDEVVSCAEALNWDLETEVSGKPSTLNFVPDEGNE